MTGMEWVRWLPDRSGAARYVVAIRAPEDPERKPREERRGLETDWRRLRKVPARELRAPVLDLLEARGPLTLNAIAVLLTDQTADVVLGDPLEEVIWALLVDELVERTNVAPIRWRRTEKDPDGPVTEASGQMAMF